MTHRYVLYTSATALLAVAALVGCTGDDDTTMNPIAMAGTGGLPPAGGSLAPGAGGTTPANPGTGGTMAPGAGGTTPAVAGTGGSSGGVAGTTGPTAGTMAGTAGTMEPAAGSGAMDVPDASAPSGAGSCGPETMLSAADIGDPKKLGPWMPTMQARSGPSGSSTLFYPMDLGKDGVKHPVFHWGCGAGSQPSQYAEHLSLLASHGIVVIANASGSMPAKASLDWLLAENEKSGSMFYQKLDPGRVGTGGHSLGALETFQFAGDPRLKAYVLVCGGSGNGNTGAKDIHAPSIFLGGEGEGGTTNFVADYDAIAMQPSIFVTKTDTDHFYCARNNLGPWVAFLRWNLCGDEKWKAEFMPDGTFCKSPWLDCKTKGL